MIEDPDLSPRRGDTETEARMKAATDMLRRTGAQWVQLRYSNDEEPTVWFAVVRHLVGEDGRPVPNGGAPATECAAALDPLRAMLRLCEQVIDGGMCAHCGRPAGLEPDSIEEPPGGKMICWYVYDPEMQTFRRGCE